MNRERPPWRLNAECAKEPSCAGVFQPRIEDTDRKRSTEEAINAILDGLEWLELDWDGKLVHQFSRGQG